MKAFECRIKGVPYSKLKSRGNKEAPKLWTEAVKEQTAKLPRVNEACIMNITFYLPPDKFPKDFPYGPDLDNLLKRFMDGLEQTLFTKDSGGDSCVISINATKARVDSNDKAGAFIQIIPIKI